MRVMVIVKATKDGEAGVLPSTVIEIHPVFEADDFDDKLTAELRAQEAEHRARLAAGT